VVRGQGSGFRGQGSGVRDQGSGFRGQGSGVRGQGPRGSGPILNGGDWLISSVLLRGENFCKGGREMADGRAGGFGRV
jgi:hypothetical protein